MPNSYRAYTDYHLRVIKTREKAASAREQEVARHLQLKTFPNWGREIEFSEREMDILVLMAHGKTANEVGDELCISPHTVKTHQKNMLKKTGCYNSIHLIACSIRDGVIR